MSREKERESLVKKINHLWGEMEFYEKFFGTGLFICWIVLVINAIVSLFL